MNRLILTAAAFAAVSAASADLDFGLGASRAAGLGGAGLAIKSTRGGPAWRNPAMYGVKNRLLQWPELQYRTKGISFSDIDAIYGSAGSVVYDSENLGRLARAFGDEETVFQGRLGLGIQFGTVGFDFQGEAAGMTLPNESLQQWVRDGADLGNIPEDASIDGFGLSTAEVGFSVAHAQDWGFGRLAYGARAKAVQATYGHHFADASTIASGGSQPGPELGGLSSLSDNGFGVDAGIFFEPDDINGLSMAVVMENLIEPAISFRGSLPQGLFGERTIDPFARSLSAGVAFQRGRLTLAGDVWDIFGTAGEQEVRAGGELWVERNLALQVGYRTRAGFAAGVSFHGFHISMADRLPVAAGYKIEF
jgi:hypothetical protein